MYVKKCEQTVDCWLKEVDGWLKEVDGWLKKVSRKEKKQVQKVSRKEKMKSVKVYLYVSAPPELNDPQYVCVSYMKIR